MELSRHLIFVMSLSGSVVVLLYKLFSPIARKYFPSSWRNTILRMALFFYLFPVPFCKEFLWSHSQNLLPFQLKAFDVHKLWTIDPGYTVNMRGSQSFLGIGVTLIYIFAFSMAVIATIVIISQLKQYHAIRRTYLLDSFTNPPPLQLINLLPKLKEELQIKKSVRIICSQLCETPLTIGVFSPVIIFPIANQLELDSVDYQYILKHELIHIKNRDLLVKFLALFALVIHWYNPICYLLYHELCVVSELTCDYGVVKDVDDIQRQQYSHLILSLAMIGSGKKERFAVGLVSNDTATFERRILEMKEIRRTSKPVLSCIVMALIFILGTITAFAYQAPIIVETDDSWTNYDEVFFSNYRLHNTDPLLYDHFFTDENGNITSLDDATPRIGCKHNFIDGYITKHKKNADGSCVVREMEGRRCTICGYSIEGALVSESKYTVCPH